MDYKNRNDERRKDAVTYEQLYSVMEYLIKAQMFTGEIRMSACIMKKQLKKKVTVASKQHVMAHCSCTCSCSLNNNYNASWGKVNYHYI